MSQGAVVLSDSPRLRAKAAATVADLETLLARSRTLVAQSVRLCRAGRRIRGGSESDSPFIIEIISKASMCLPCVASKTGISPTRIAEVIERIRSFIVVENGTGRCAGCLQVTSTYRVPDHTAPDALERRPIPSTLNAALWRFLEDHRDQMFCTQCIANALFATKRIDRAVLGAEGRGARRQYGACASCGKERLLCGLVR